MSAELEHVGHACIKCDRELVLSPIVRGFKKCTRGWAEELTSNDVGGDVYLSAETEEGQGQSGEQTKGSDGEHAPPSVSIKYLTLHDEDG